jgi:tetratricopeptide (TPR) repeat protein
MFRFLKKFFPFRKRPGIETNRDEPVYEKWIADFTKPNQTHFEIKSEKSYDANAGDPRAPDSLIFSLKKTSCFAWLENPVSRYGDLILEGRISLDSCGGYAATGFIFRMVDESTYYSALVSGKGYFRLDVLRNGAPQTLIGWTEVPGGSALPETGPVFGSVEGLQDNANGVKSFCLTVIAYGSHIVILINSRWAAELHDATISAGRIGFALASYESPGSLVYTAEAFLKELTVESRIAEVEAAYERWSDETAVPVENRLHLAETFAAMGQNAAALVQLKRGWGTSERTDRELLLACRLAFALGLEREAEEYADACISLGTGALRGALAEKARILYTTRRFAELREFGERALEQFSQDAVFDGELLILLGHAYWETGDYEKAAASYDRSFERDGTNGFAAKNAANTWEVLGGKTEALDRYLRGGRAFLTRGNYGDLGTMVPKILSLGAENWEAHALAGKWAFGIEDWAMAKAEFDCSDRLRVYLPVGTESTANHEEPSPEPVASETKTESLDQPVPYLPVGIEGAANHEEPSPDPAVVFLRGLLLLREGKRSEALPFLEKAAAMEPEYPLFRFKVAENRFFLTGDGSDPALRADLDAALTLDGENGWVWNLAAEAALAREDLEGAASSLEKAASLLGEVPAIQVNRAEILARRGSAEEALMLLEAVPGEDPEGIMANCAGNILVREGRFEEAGARYVRALVSSPGNVQYLANRASCLVALSRFGEADEMLTQAHQAGPNPVILELIAYVAAQKGEYRRAETACKAALEIDSNHAPALLTLCGIYAARFRWEEASEILRRLDTLSLDAAAVTRREELRSRLDEALNRRITCASCGRSWQVPRSPPPVKPIRLFAMPPDDLPAGSCPSCGKTWCIGCAKESVDDSGRFRCPECGRSLKLIDQGLKKLINDWAEREIIP